MRPRQVSGENPELDQPVLRMVFMDKRIRGHDVPYVEEYIPLDRCKKGFLYRIRSRNLAIGVFNGETGFIGLRTKFGCRYIFTEYHWDTGHPYGTVCPTEELRELPSHIEPIEVLGSIAMDTNLALFKWLDEMLTEFQNIKKEALPYS